MDFDPTIPVSPVVFVQNYKTTVNFANSIFNLDFKYNGNGWNTFIGACFQEIARLDQESEFIGRDLELNKLLTLLSMLSEIKHHDKNLFDHFDKRISEINNHHNWYGLKSEIMTTCKLIQSKIIFQKGESPDFTISYEGKIIGIEAGSTHLDNQKNKDLSYKIISEIREKDRTPYANLSLSLHLDFTNLFYSSKFHPENDYNPITIKLIQDEINNNKIGSLILFFTYYSDTQRKLTVLMKRIDNILIDPKLKKFSDEHFPFGKDSIGPGIFPKMG